MVEGGGKAKGGCIIPTLRYRKAKAAIEWLCEAFGFEKMMVVPGEGETIAHAQLKLGTGIVMLGDAKTEFGTLVRPPEPPALVNTQGIYVVVEKVDDHYARAKASGAEIVLPIKTQDYGGRDYTCRDLEGHIWTFGTYDPWVS